MIRDLIDLANGTDEDAALIFLDQEKAFDRVNHDFLYKVMKCFGFGEYFTSWIKLLYSNASTRVSINGFLTDKIPLNSGVRQGCPLSALLYVLVIETLALQLRTNQNIVGFTIENEKLISSHYSDDAVIKITQNRCFKEVYKDLQLYEEGSGAKINYGKTKGLWLGKWKNRTDDPFQELYTDHNHKITWTSGNVRHLGIYVGNENPALQTFHELVPKIKKRLNFWKPLKLPILAKARVIEIFHASKLWFAASFYPIPTHLESELNKAFMDYIIFPKHKIEVSRMEMEKLRLDGGIKLINIKLKSETPKVQWLTKLITDKELKQHLHIFNSLIGTQKGGLRGQDIIFTEHSYVTRHLVTDNSFYFEAFYGITKLDTAKYYDNLNDEHLFFNPIFTTPTDEDMHETTLKPFYGNKALQSIKTYGDLLRTTNNPRVDAILARKKDSIEYIRESVSDSQIRAPDYTVENMKDIAHKFIYGALILQKSMDHEYQAKWDEEEDSLMMNMWPQIWENIHNQFYTEEVKSTVWEQLHLNFYTTYNYNKWHNSLTPCPLCGKIPDTVYHVIIYCNFTNALWKRLESTLKRIYPKNIIAFEKAFGLQPDTKKEKPRTILRNWITFTLRHHIMKEERKAYYQENYKNRDITHFMKNFEYILQQEMKIKYQQFKSRGLSTKFERIALVGNVLGEIKDDEFLWSGLGLTG